ncbi:MAG: hypothetical protein WD426_04855 [Anditalea sp.]
MKERMMEYEFYIFSNHNHHVKPRSIHRRTDKKKVLLYLSDENNIDPIDLSNDYFAIFKAYLGSYLKVPNVFPLTLGCVKGVPELPIIPINKRKINVFFRGNLNKSRIDFYRNFSPIKRILPPRKILKRLLYIKLLIKFKNNFSCVFPNSIIIFNKAFKSGLMVQEYGEVIANSKIILCPNGFTSAESFRHYEAMRAGCVVISEKLPEIDFYRGSPIIQIEDWKDGLRVARDLLKNEEELENIQREIIEWWNNKCSELATAKYIRRCLLDL